MPVMKRLTIDSVNYDTVGEASVTQVQTSGTKIATVTIDGTATDLYAPEGGGGGSTVTVTPILTSGTQTATISVDGTTSTLYAPTPPTVPSASTTTPLMDGTASYGSGTSYARSNHVHPTDTSLVPKSATNGSKATTIANNGNRLMLAFEEGDSYSDVILGRNAGPSIYATDGTNSATVDVLPTGVLIDKLAAPFTSTMPTTKQYVDDGLAAKQATLVSGTNIKTVNGTSILGSGDITTPTYTLPTASTSTLGGVKVDGSTITITDGVISSSGGGGGGSELTLYTDGSFTNLWIDAAKTTTLFESFEYDYHVAKAEMSKFSAIKIWDRYLDTVYFVNRWKVDPTDETFEVAFGLATYVTVSGGTSYWLLQAKSISLS